MTPHEAAKRWQEAQQQILMVSYVNAWKAGASNYRTSTATPAIGSSSGPQASVQPPVRPNGAAMQKAMQPALQSLARITAGAVTLVPPHGVPLPAAMVAYLLHHTYKLAGGASVAWAGEQAGYAESAQADGQLLRWQLDGGAKHCVDCPALAALPPMPLDQWPTFPGGGATDCGAGCKCSFIAAGVIVPSVLTGSQIQDLQRVAGKVPALVAV